MTRKCLPPEWVNHGKEQRGSHSAFCNLLSEITDHFYLFCVLDILKPPHWERASLASSPVIPFFSLTVITSLFVACPFLWRAPVLALGRRVVMEAVMLTLPHPFPWGSLPYSIRVSPLPLSVISCPELICVPAWLCTSLSLAMIMFHRSYRFSRLRSYYIIFVSISVSSRPIILPKRPLMGKWLFFWHVNTLKDLPM